MVGILLLLLTARITFCLLLLLVSGLLLVSILFLTLRLSCAAKDDKRVLYSGIPLRKEIELANGRKFTPLLQVNVEHLSRALSCRPW